MSQVFKEIDGTLEKFIMAQKMFFIATAPLSDDGLVNLSPKGLEDTFRVLDPKTVAYLDMTGSGVETIAHLKENGRCVIMFCAFEGPPKIIRLHGAGEVVEKGHAEFESLMALFPKLTGTRAIIRVHVKRIADSCGWGVPLYDFNSQRETYGKFAEKVGDAGMKQAQRQYNMKSLDGLPGLAAQSV